MAGIDRAGVQRSAFPAQGGQPHVRRPSLPTDADPTVDRVHRRGLHPTSESSGAPARGLDRRCGDGVDRGCEERQRGQDPRSARTRRARRRGWSPAASRWSWRRNGDPLPHRTLLVGGRANDHGCAPSAPLVTAGSVPASLLNAADVELSAPTTTERVATRCCQPPSSSSPFEDERRPASLVGNHQLVHHGRAFPLGHHERTAVEAVGRAGDGVAVEHRKYRQAAPNDRVAQVCVHIYLAWLAHHCSNS